MTVRIACLKDFTDAELVIWGGGLFHSLIGLGYTGGAACQPVVTHDDPANQEREKECF